MSVLEFVRDKHYLCCLVLVGLILCDNCLVSADIISIFVLFSAVLLALSPSFIHQGACNTSW
jgi:hypothetical protein